MDDIRVLIADDEPGIRLVLRKALEKAEGFVLAGEAADGEELMRLFERERPQLVFLDVDMPLLSGVECANRIQDADPACAIVFATAHEEYRSEAFEVYAFDYLVKPFRMDRLYETLSRVRVGRHAAAAKEKPVAAECRSVSGRLMLKHRDGVTFVGMEDILLIQREERATVIYTAGDGRFVIGDTLAQTEARLDPAVFFRCHKSYIINLNRIKNITPYGRWTYVVQLEGTKQDALITYEKYEALQEMFG